MSCTSVLIQQASQKRCNGDGKLSDVVLQTGCYNPCMSHTATSQPFPEGGRCCLSVKMSCQGCPGRGSAAATAADSMSQVAQAEAQQLTEAQAEAKSAVQQLVSPTSQLSAMIQKAEASEECVNMVLQQQMSNSSFQSSCRLSLS